MQGALERVIAVVVRRPRTVLAAWGLLIAVLAVVGLGVSTKLHNTSLTIPGTPSARAAGVTDRAFGPSEDLIVLLSGAERAIARQEPRFITQLQTIPGLQLVSPTPRQAGIHQHILLLRLPGSFQAVSRGEVARVRGILTRVQRTGGVHAYLSGYADVGSGLYTSTIDAIHSAEFIATPVLLLVLLLVFGAPLAAVLPLLVGLGTIGAGAGALVIVNEFTPLDALALNMATMMGLALGVDYSLLLVSRFRTELRAGVDPPEAVARALRTAGHTVVCAGAALLAVMITAIAVMPGTLLISAVVGVTVALMLSLPAALLPVPAALVLLGRGIDRWAIPRRGSGRLAAALAGSRVKRRPGMAAGAVALICGVIAAPAMALQTGPPDISELPPGSIQRNDFNVIKRTLGKGWTTPYQVTLTVPTGHVTDPRRLRAIARWEHQVAALPGVRAVFGPGAIAPAAQLISSIPARLQNAGAALHDGEAQAGRLGSTVDRDSSQITTLVGGLQAATDGATRLHDGGAAALDGSRQLAGGLGIAGSGASRLSDGLQTALGGAQRLGTGSGELTDGAQRLATALSQAQAAVRSGPVLLHALASQLRANGDAIGALKGPAGNAQSSLASALSDLNGMLPTSKLDPAYRRALGAIEAAQTALGGINGGLDSGQSGADAAAASVDGATGQLGQLQTGLAALHGGAVRLAGGLHRLRGGLARLTGGLERLGGGGRQLASGLQRLAGGGRRLSDGLAQLDAGTGTLAAGLSGGLRTVAPIAGTAHRLRGALASETARLRGLARDTAGSAQLGRVSRSGLLVLAAIDTAGAARRMAASFAVNIDRGGNAASIVVVGQGGQTRAGSPLRAALGAAAARLARATGGQAYVGGPAATMQDFDSSTAARFPLLVAALSLITTLVLARLLGSLVLAALAVALNLITTGAALGVLVLVFQGSDPLGGGPGWLDAVSAIGVFSVMFALSIDYEVFLLSRMREAYRETGTLDGAIDAGLIGTAPVVIGAAVVMAAVFVVFATTDMDNIKELGIGLSAAIILDSTLIRLVLLPACIRLVGDRCFEPRSRRRKVAAAALSSPVT